MSIIRFSPDDIRAKGWSVAIHNDYRLDGRAMTFWLFTNVDAGRFVQGEAETDAEALDIVRDQIKAFELIRDAAGIRGDMTLEFERAVRRP